jgi:hypothetical protein
MTQWTVGTVEVETVIFLGAVAGEASVVDCSLREA